MEPVNPCHVERIRITPDIDNSCIRLKTTLTACGTVHAVIRAGERVLFDADVPEDAEIPVSELHLWSPETPFLYDLTVSVSHDGAVADTIESYFGMRKYSVGSVDGVTRLFLNNKPYFQRGLLDQGYFPDGGLTPPTDEAMVYDIQTMKDLGFNMLRKHIKVDLPRWYYHCDRLGMLVWQDMVSGGRYIGDFFAGVVPNILCAVPRLTPFSVKDNHYKLFSREKPEWRAAFETELHEMMDTLCNCVSLYCWVPFNEGWGQFDSNYAYMLIRSMDNTRIVDSASGWHDRGDTDIISKHIYFTPIKVRSGDKPWCLTEFGGLSTRVKGHTFNDKMFGYKIFNSKEGLTKAFANLYEKTIIPQIKDGLSATVYTQVTDVEDELNGLFTYDRKVQKIDTDVIKSINERIKI